MIIAQAAQGKPVQIPIGANIDFELHANGPTGTTVDSARSLNTTVLQEVIAATRPGPTSTATYRAIAPGTALVIAGIHLPCPSAPATPCVVAEDAFQFRVTVAPSTPSATHT